MEKIAYVVIGTALGVVLTLILKPIQSIDTAAMPMMEANKMAVKMLDMHQHPLRNVSPDKPVPSVTHLVFPDIMGGYNVQIIPRNFEFTAAAINREVKNNQGHAHIYVNGIKVSRVYSKWYYLSAGFLKPGVNTVSVTLNANDHSEWAINGGRILSNVRVVKAE
jgi:hypothetical protein